MIRFIEAKKNYIMALAVLFVIVSLSGTTYSLFIKSDTTNTFNYNTGLLDLKFTEDKQITLESAFPMNDSAGTILEPYTLTIKNTGNLIYKYDLKMLSSDNENVIDNKYIKVKVNDDLPHTLFTTNNVIASDLIIYPGEEQTFKINIWLDMDTPNIELGKKFIAKVVSSGTAIYKTLDNSGANRPNQSDKMIPIYYDENAKVWRKADESNTIESYRWYDYNASIWANSVIINDSEKVIYDLTRNNDLKLNNPTINNGNLILEDSPLDIGLSNYNNSNISAILRIKVNELTSGKIALITNDKINYYYNLETKKFVFENDGVSVSSETYTISENTWYILGFTYDGNNLNFYANGAKISSTNIRGNIISSSSFKIGDNKEDNTVSNITVGDIYIYNDILSENVINSNYKTSIDVVYENLIEGYNEFTPMTLKEYYKSQPLGTTINNKDINSYYVWIPRFKYKLWNATGENISSYNAEETGIDIIFEKNTDSSGVIHCKDNTCYSDDLLITKITKNDNDKYYTHPAFTNIDTELNGFWVSKYEVSNNNNQIESKPNANVWVNNYLSDYYQQIKKLGTNYSMIKNSEWGAIAYLSHSKYGVCDNNTCQTISPNNTYVSGTNLSDTTTGNSYGVYDMSGSAAEFTMSNYTETLNELSLDNSNFANIPISNKDYDLYYKDTFILGDATKELSDVTGTWIDTTNNWLARGGIANQKNSSIFSYSATTDTASNYLTTRIIIK